MRPVDALIDHLKSEVARGKTHVLLDEEAREGLRELFIKSREAAKSSTATSKLSKQAPTAAASPAMLRLKTTATNTATSMPENMPLLKVHGETREESLESLRQQAENWAPVKALGSLRSTMVFGSGSPHARLMLVGEAPGHEEERRREPFVGPAGRKLDDILKAMDLSRQDVYISNILKFRPLAPRQTINNRTPTPEEIASCLPFVLKEIEIVKPDCIIALGVTAAVGLLKLQSSVESMREQWHSLDGIPTRVTYHPSYLLQSEANNDIKRKLWEDMLAVMDKLGLPISDKQRGFFLTK